MPKSRVRKKKIYTPPTDVVPSADADKKRPSPQWVPGLAIGLIIFGMAWLVTYYLTSAAYPVAAWGAWNIGIGFGAIVAALGIFTQWR